MWAAIPWCQTVGKGHTASGQDQISSKPEYRSVPIKKGLGRRGLDQLRGEIYRALASTGNMIQGTILVELTNWDCFARKFKASGEGRRSSATDPGFSPVIGSGNPSPLSVPPNPAGVSRRATRGPSLPHGSSTLGKDGRLRHN